METSSGAMGGIVGAHLPIKGSIGIPYLAFGRDFACIAWGSFVRILTLAIQRIQMKC
jgi:hypothetical protein